ncbi:MAG: hypothetical protein KDB37_09560 [Ilumatobacter sp.]|nr:hypothetical protein [Ilumatobacter sp.]
MAAIAGITLVLAAVDVIEAILAKEWSERRSVWLLVGGVAAAIALFALFSVAMRYSDMSTVTLGWIVVMQVGLMVTERVRYGVDHGLDRWAAVAGMVALQAYLLFRAAEPAAG